MAEKKPQPSQPGIGRKLYRIVQTIFRILLGALLFFAGIAHLTVARTEFLAQVPTWLPVDGGLVVVLSGIAEIALGLALIFLVKQRKLIGLAAAAFFILIFLVKQRKLIGLAAAAFFILIFPGNISQYVNQIDAFGLNTDQARFNRLFFQPVLVVWALWSTDAWRLFFPSRALS